MVTMLFCDVTGSTAAAEQLDPEDWAQIMNGAFEHLIAPVYRYEGTLARQAGHSGDAAEAERLRSRARDVIRYIGDRAGSPESGAAFLNSPKVANLMGAS